MTPQETTATIIGITMAVGAVALVIYMAVLILQGKGDGLIAGYNTMSDEKKARYDIVRLRKLTGWFCIATAGCCIVLGPCLPLCKSKVLPILLVTIIMLLAIVEIWLANTWAKKK